MLSCACSDGDQAADLRRSEPPSEVIVHPKPEGLLSSSADVRVIDIETTQTDPILPMLEALADFDSTVAIGMAEGPPDLTFGTITAGTFLSDGRVALVDVHHGTVRLLDDRLQPVGRVGTFGEGPGEFMSPSGVAEDTDGSLLVLDKGQLLQRIERFRRSGAGFKFDRRLALPIVPFVGRSGFCALDERVFVAGVLAKRNAELAQQDERWANQPFLTSPFLVHEVGDDGEIIRSFSAPYSVPWNRMRELGERMSDQGVAFSLAIDFDVTRSLGSARLACDDQAGGRVWVAYTALGEVHLHTADGELLWIARIRDFEWRRLNQSIYSWGTGLGGDPYPLTFDALSDLALIAPDILAVQAIWTRINTDRSTNKRFRTYFIKAASGEVLGSVDSGHRVMSGGNYRALLYREALHPQVQAVRLGG